MERRMCKIKESDVCETMCILNLNSKMDGNIDSDGGSQHEYGGNCSMGMFNGI